MNVIITLVDYGIIGLLLLMSILSMGIALERVLYFRSVDIHAYSTKQELEMDLSRGLVWIATVASNAPYVGLLGTVLGILLTFYTIGTGGMVDTKRTMVGLALALKATAVGLAVAIPSTVLYNYLVRRVRELVLLWEVKNGRQRV